MTFSKVTPLAFLLLFNLSSICVMTGQKKYQPPTQRLVHIEKEDRSVGAMISTRKKTRPKPSKTYFWYDNVTVKATQGGYSGYLLHGPYSEYYYPGGVLLAQGRFSKGRMDGSWLYWDANGFLTERARWKKGALDGDRKIFDKGGQLNKTEVYKNNVLRNTVYHIDTSSADELPRVEDSLNTWQRLRYRLRLKLTRH